MLYDGFETWDDVLAQYNAPAGYKDVLPLMASYSYEDYSGMSTVLFIKDNKLFSVYGSHCSCYGLEDQWGPEEIKWEIAVEYLQKTGGFDSAIPLVAMLADSPNREEDIGEARIVVKLKYS